MTTTPNPLSTEVKEAIRTLVSSGFLVGTDTVTFLEQLPIVDRPRLISFLVDALTKRPNPPTLIDVPLIQDLLKPAIKPLPAEQPSSLSHPASVTSVTPVTPILQATSTATAANEKPPIKQVKSPPVKPFVPAVSRGSGTRRHPLAKEVQSQLEVLMTPAINTSGTTSSGSFIALFQDRYARLSKLVREQGLSGLLSIQEAIRSGSSPLLSRRSEDDRTEGTGRNGGDEIHVIGMVISKQVTKNGNLLLVIEDPTGELKCIVSQRKEDLTRLAETVLHDQVIGIAGRMINGGFMFVSQIIWPDIPVSHAIPLQSEESVSAALISDLHVGSRECLEDVISRFVMWLRGEVGDARERQIAERIKYLVIAGDLVDGIGVYPGQQEDLAIADLRDQYLRAAKFLEEVPDYIELIVIPGNHDAVRQALPQPPIPRDFGEGLYDLDRVRLLGNPSYIRLHGAEIAVVHGDSLNDIVQAMPGVDYNHPERAMQALVRCRHLAPIYGGNTLLAPEPRDWLVLERVPHVIHAGHIHINSVAVYRSTLMVNSGTFQKQTEYMRMNGIAPTPGVVPVVDLDTLNVSQLSFLELAAH